MAKIEMDLSEYEAIQESKKLLEKSLERERDLQEQVKKLHEEKIEALEKAKKKIVKIVKTQHREIGLVRREPGDIIRALFRKLGLDTRNLDLRLPVSDEYGRGVIENFMDAFFDVTDTTSIIPDEVTMHGLDEIKAELREDIKNQIDKATKRKLEDYDDLQERYNALEDAHKVAIASNKNLEEDNKKLVKINNELEEDIANERLKLERERSKGSSNQIKLEEIKSEVADASSRLFGKTTLIQNIYKIINRK